MSAIPTTEDFEALQSHFESAIAVQEMIAWKDGLPNYPVPISTFFNYITSSPWCDYQYDPADTNDILNRIDTANISEVRSALTAISRIERFCTGAWEDALENEYLSSVIERARELTNA